MSEYFGEIFQVWWLGEPIGTPSPVPLKVRKGELSNIWRLANYVGDVINLAKLELSDLVRGDSVFSKGQNFKLLVSHSSLSHYFYTCSSSFPCFVDFRVFYCMIFLVYVICSCNLPIVWLVFLFNFILFYFCDYFCVIFNEYDTYP